MLGLGLLEENQHAEVRIAALLLVSFVAAVFVAETFWAETPEGKRVFIRPIKPEDEHLYGAFVAKLSPEDIRFRFLTPRKEFSHRFIARFTQIDYARVPWRSSASTRSKTRCSASRGLRQTNYTRAEYAVIVRSDLKCTGIGWALMRHLIHYAAVEGLHELYGEVLSTNTRMLEMCSTLGFDIAANPEDPTISKVRLTLPGKLYADWPRRQSIERA